MDVALFTPARMCRNGTIENGHKEGYKNGRFLSEIEIEHFLHQGKRLLRVEDSVKRLLDLEDRGILYVFSSLKDPDGFCGILNLEKALKGFRDFMGP